MTVRYKHVTIESRSNHSLKLLSLLFFLMFLPRANNERLQTASFSLVIRSTVYRNKTLGGDPILHIRLNAPGGGSEYSPEKIIWSKGSYSSPVECEHSRLKGTGSSNSHTLSTCITPCLLGVLDFIMRQFGYINIFIAGGWTQLLTLQAMQMAVALASGTNVEC